MGRPRTRTPELRRTVLDAALELLRDGGHGAITMRAVAAAAGTSQAAVGELFDGKDGLVEAMHLAGFALLRDELAALPITSDAVDDVVALCDGYRSFASAHPQLFDVMFSRPFESFHPSKADDRVAQDLYDVFVVRVQTLLAREDADASVIDVTTGLVALLFGLASQQRSGLLGSTAESQDRRWRRAVGTYVDGCAPTRHDHHTSQPAETAGPREGT
ncbi:MAG: TetR-like C-terminal domain-containing protein [Actinomycetota bacterium]